MFKKITSDRDPRDTVFTELSKEFKPYLRGTSAAFKSIADNYPKFLFCMMVVNITLSVILVLTVFRPERKPLKAVTPNELTPVSGGFDRIIQAGVTLQRTIHLKRQVDSLSGKRLLNKADSATLSNDLDSLQLISKPFNPMNDEH